MDLDAFFTNTGLHHIGLEVIRHLDERSLAICRLVNRSWCKLITESREWACGSLNLLVMTKASGPLNELPWAEINTGLQPKVPTFTYKVLMFWLPFRDVMKKNQTIEDLWTFARFLDDETKPHPKLIQNILNYLNFQLMIGLEKLMENGNSRLVILILEWLKKDQVISTHFKDTRDQFDCTSEWALVNGTCIGLRNITRLILTDPLMEGINVNHKHNGIPIVVSACQFTDFSKGLSKVKILKEVLADPSIEVNAMCDGSFKTALHYSVFNLDVEAVKSLLSVPNIDVNVRDADGKTPLLTALELSKPKALEVVPSKPRVISMLLDHPNIDANAVGAHGITPLMYAMCLGFRDPDLNERLKPVSDLLQAGVNVHATNNSGQSAIELACKLGKLEEFKLLYNHANDIIHTRTSCLKKKSLLHLVIIEINEVKKGNLYVDISDGTTYCIRIYRDEKDFFPNLFKILEFLIDNESFDVNVKDADGLTPLHYALNQPDTQVMEYLLLCKKVDVNARDNMGRTPLRIAIINEDNEKEKLLMQHEKIDYLGHTTLMDAIMRGSCEDVTALLQNIGDDIYAICNHLGVSAIERACMMGRFEEFKLIYNYANDVIYRETSSYHYNRSLLHIAITKIYDAKMVSNQTPVEGFFKIMEFLIGIESYEVNERDADGLTPLHHATNQPDIHVMECLLRSKSIDVNIQNNLGQTPLHTVVSNQDLAKTRLLLQHTRIDVNALAAVSRETPLHIASNNKDGLEILKILLEVPNLIRNPLDSMGRKPSDNCHNIKWLDGYALLIGKSHLVQGFRDSPMMNLQRYNITVLSNGHQVSNWCDDQNICDLFNKYITNLQ